MSTGTHDPGRRPSLAESRTLDRDTIRRIPGITDAQWRDYCGVYLGLPVKRYAQADAPVSAIRWNVVTARETIVRFLATELGETVARDFLAVEVERRPVAARASERGVSRSTVHGNVGTAKDRLPRLVDDLEGEA